MAVLGDDVWSAPDNEPNGQPYRTCSYCGSIHPEDLLKYLQDGAKLEQADWKYGWPHKTYVKDVPNPRAHEPCVIGSSYRDGVRTDITGPAPETLHIKWYNRHLMDRGYSAEALTALTTALSISGISWSLHEKEDGEPVLRFIPIPKKEDMQ